MKNNKTVKKSLIHLALVVLILVLVGITDFLSFGYWIKTAIKITLFLLLPVLLLKVEDKTVDFKLKTTKKTTSISLAIGFILIVSIIGGYFLIRNWIDLSNIPQALEQNFGFNKHNFWPAFFYIPIVNAFLEEFFFRNYIHHVAKTFKKWTVIFLSAALFAVYHVSILNNWANLWVIVGAIIGLFAVGVFFSYIRSKTKSMLPTYIMHGFANIGINIVALIVLGII